MAFECTYFYVKSDCTGHWTTNALDVELADALVVGELSASDPYQMTIKQSRIYAIHESEIPVSFSYFFKVCAPDTIKRHMRDTVAHILTDSHELGETRTYSEMQQCVEEPYLQFLDLTLKWMIHRGTLAYTPNADGADTYKFVYGPPPVCVTPNGRTDCHCVYVTGTPVGIVCTFCHRPVA